MVGNESRKVKRFLIILSIAMTAYLFGACALIRDDPCERLANFLCDACGEETDTCIDAQESVDGQYYSDCDWEEATQQLKELKRMKQEDKASFYEMCYWGGDLDYLYYSDDDT